MKISVLKYKELWETKFNFPFAGLVLAAFPTDPATEKRENVDKEIRNTINLKCREYAYKQKQSQQK